MMHSRWCSVVATGSSSSTTAISRCYRRVMDTSSIRRRRMVQLLHQELSYSSSSSSSNMNTIQLKAVTRETIRRRRRLNSSSSNFHHQQQYYYSSSSYQSRWFTPSILSESINQLTTIIESNNNNDQQQQYTNHHHHNKQQRRWKSSVAPVNNDEYDDEFEEDIERFSKSSLNEILPNDIFYNDDEEQADIDTTLDEELGMDTIWDSAATATLDEEDDVDDISVEKIAYPNRTVQSQQQQQSSSSFIDQYNNTTFIPDDDDDNYDEDISIQQHQTKKTKTKRKLKSKKSIQESAMEILRNFDPDKPPSKDNLHHYQLWLECYAQQEAINKYQKVIDNARNRNAFDNLGFMSKQIIQWYQPLRDAIDQRQKDYLSDARHCNNTIENDKQQNDIENNNDDDDDDNNNNNNKIKGSERRARTRYGPFLCSLSPEKMAVIVATEAVTYCLLSQSVNGATLVGLAKHVANAVEMETASQRQIHKRFAIEKEKLQLMKQQQQELEKRQQEQQQQQNDNEEHDYDDDTTINDQIANNEFMTIEDDDEDNNDNNLTIDKSIKIDDDTIIKRPRDFSTAHLKKFLENLEHNDPQFKKTKRNIEFAIRRLNREDEWTPFDRIHIGAALVAILIENATITTNIDGGMQKEVPAFTVEKKWIKGPKCQTYIILNDTLSKLFLEDRITSFAATTTRHTPMIVPPDQWITPNVGGYKWLKVDMMRYRGSNVQKEAMMQSNLKTLCDGLNVLGKTEWKINSNMLNIAKHCWNNNIPIGDIPSRNDHIVPEAPERPKRIDPELYANTDSIEHKEAMEAFRAFREGYYKNRKFRQKNMDLRSLRCSAMLKLNQAEAFKDFDKIYFPYSVDFRGRAYPIPPHLSNVGSDLCRGVLTFANAKPLGKRGLYWLKVHLANFAGKDKMSFDERASYIDDNMDNVRAAVTDPFASSPNGDYPWWMDLEDPFQGLATCHEIVNAIDSGNPETYMCALPVHMDGSCNGLQHYAALGRDTVGGKAVNLLEGDGPEDVYVGVMNEVIRRVAEEAERTLDFVDNDPSSLTQKQKKELKYNQAAKLVNGFIDRGVVKRTVMTSVYGVTFIGARTQIMEKIEEKLEEGGYNIDDLDREIFDASGYLATLTIEVMGDLFQGARKTKSWLAECARLISKFGHPVAWVSPIGIPVVQPYRQKRSRTILTVMQSISVVDYPDDMPIHKAKQCTAFPPNYVHSLDSSHMILTALEMDKRGLEFSAVHDSFWTHACDVDEMNEALRDCFVDLYSQPLLQDLKESWELRYPDIEFPELPELGDLNLDEVKTATYFFQ